MANTEGSRTPTKYLNSKGRRIFLSAQGKAFVNVDGRRQYKPVAKKMTNNSGLNRNLRPNNVKNVPNTMRPKRVAAPKKAPAKKAPKRTNSMKATNMFRKILNKPAVRKTRSNKGVARKSAEEKMATKMLAAAKRAAAGPGKRGPNKAPRKTRSNKGVARGPQPGVVQRRMNAESKKMAAKGPRKTRSNAGKPRTMIASPGGTVYKGLAALTRALAKRANAMNNVSTATSTLRRSVRAKKVPAKLRN